MAKRKRTDVALQAEQWFAFYYSMGAHRSLAALREYGRRVSAPGLPSVKTLERWSVAYRWQERVAELDAATQRESTEKMVLDIRRMNEDQAAIGAMGVQLAAFSLERMLRQVRQADVCQTCGLGPLELDAQDVSRVMEVFAKWQRLAMGEVTERSEIAITIWNIIIQEFMQLFLAVNIYDDADQRKREMAVGVDDIVGRHLTALAGK